MSTELPEIQKVGNPIPEAFFVMVEQKGNEI